MSPWEVNLCTYVNGEIPAFQPCTIHAIFLVYLFGPIPPLYEHWMLKPIYYICPCHQPPQAGRPCSRRTHGPSSRPASCWSHRTAPCRGDQRDWGEHKKIKGTRENTNPNQQVYIQVKLTMHTIQTKIHGGWCDQYTLECLTALLPL